MNITRETLRPAVVLAKFAIFIGVFSLGLESVCAQAQSVRLESVLPRMRARLGGLLEREDVQVVEVQRYGGGGSR